VFGQVFGKVGVFFGLDNGEIVAVDHVSIDRAGGLYEVVEKLADLGRTAGDVDDFGTVFEDPCADFVGAFFGHHFGAVRPCIDVAMGAGLVALAADVDLEGLEATAGERRVVGVEFALEGIHVREMMVGRLAPRG